MIQKRLEQLEVQFNTHAQPDTSRILLNLTKPPLPPHGFELVRVPQKSGKHKGKEVIYYYCLYRDKEGHRCGEKLSL